jgi:hypothetical protein
MTGSHDPQEVWRAAIKESLDLIQGAQPRIPHTAALLGALNAYMMSRSYRRLHVTRRKGRHVIALSETQNRCEQVRRRINELELPAVDRMEIEERPDTKGGYKLFIRLVPPLATK